MISTLMTVNASKELRDASIRPKDVDNGPKMESALKIQISWCEDAANLVKNLNVSTKIDQTDVNKKLNIWAHRIAP